MKANTYSSVGQIPELTFTLLETKTVVNFIIVRGFCPIFGSIIF